MFSLRKRRTLHDTDRKSFFSKRKIFQKYAPPGAGYRSAPTFDLRLIVIRHGERVDTSYGDNWYSTIFGDNPTPNPQVYQDPRLPLRLPQRSPGYYYILDPPITRQGQQKAYAHGQQLARLIHQVNYCYTSPASRCVLTADAILKGMNRAQVPLRIEPYLFEPMNWNTALQGYRQISPFISSKEWASAGYNIDGRYRRINNYVNPFENEYEYYRRSVAVYSAINRHAADAASPYGYGSPQRRPRTVLIIGHAASPVIFPTVVSGQAFNLNEFVGQVKNITFLHTIVLERDAATQEWSLSPFVYRV